MILNKEIDQRLLDEIRAVLSYESTRRTWKNKFESKEFKLAEIVGRKVGSPLNRSINCGCIDDLFIVLKILIKNSHQKPLEHMKEKKFLLKGMLMIHGIDPFTNDNITDEKAVDILRMNKKNISHFSHYPEDWEALVDGKKVNAPVVAKVVQLVKTEADEPAKEVPMTREQELNVLDKAVLKRLADSLYEAGKAEKKVHFKAGVEKLVDYILTHE